MKRVAPIDIIEICSEVLGAKVTEFDLPSPSFDVMQCEVMEFDDVELSIVVKLPVLRSWLNPYGTMQGGMTSAAIDNAVGPLSLLVAPLNVTRYMESKLISPITMDLEYIYVKASLVEQKKKRLIFEVTIEDASQTVYTKAKVTNWIIV